MVQFDSLTSLIGLTQSDLMTSLSHGTADWFSPVSVANELSAQHSNIWLVFVVAVCSVLQKPSTFPSSTCIDLLRGDHVCYRGLFISVICAAEIILTCSQQHVVEVLAVASLSTCSSVADLFHQDQTHLHCHVHNHANPAKSWHHTNKIKANRVIIVN